MLAKFYCFWWKWNLCYLLLKCTCTFLTPGPFKRALGWRNGNNHGKCLQFHPHRTMADPSVVDPRLNWWCGPAPLQKLEGTTLHSRIGRFDSTENFGQQNKAEPITHYRLSCGPWYRIRPDTIQAVPSNYFTKHVHIIFDKVVRFCRILTQTCV